MKMQLSRFLISFSAFAFGLFFFGQTFAAVPVANSSTIVTAGTGSAGHFQDGDTLSFSIVFDQIVNVTGNPQISFNIAGATERAIYASGSGTDTLVFNYAVSASNPVSDFNGISLTGSYIASGGVIENAANEVFTGPLPTQAFSVDIDSAIPAFQSGTLSSTDGIVSGGIRYLKAGDNFTFVLTTTQNETSSSTGNYTADIGGTTGTVNFNNSESGSTNTFTKTSANSFITTQNGPLTVTASAFQDQANNALTGFAGPIAATPAIVVDTTEPVIAFSDNVESDPSTADTITIDVTEVNPNTTTHQYGFSSNAVCDATDVFGNTFTSGTAFQISDETQNGNYICAKATDLAGNTGYFLSANPLNIDITTPKFQSIGVSSNGPNAGFANATSTLTFTMTLSATDSYNGGGEISVEILDAAGAIKSTQMVSFTQVQSANKISQYTGTLDLSTLPANTVDEGGTLNIAAISFEDRAGNMLQNFTTQVPAPTVVIDTTAPTLASATVQSNGNTGTAANTTWARAGQIVTYTLNFSENIIRSALNTSSAANNVSVGPTKEFNRSAFGNSDSIQFTIINGDNGTVTLSDGDYTISDRAGNTTTFGFADISALIMSTTIIADTTIPVISNTSIESNNAIKTLAKTNDTITISATTADNLSPTTSLWAGTTILSRAVTADNLTGAVGAKKIELFTNGTEASETVVPFGFAIIDEAGNTSVGQTTTSDGSAVQYDRTNPVINAVQISAESADSSAYLGDACSNWDGVTATCLSERSNPTYYAKSADTVRFSFQTCDYTDVTVAPAGTFDGKNITMTDAGLTTTNCTTSGGNTGKWRNWTFENTAFTGTEGVIPFDIEVEDQTGNSAEKFSDSACTTKDDVNGIFIQAFANASATTKTCVNSGTVGISNRRIHITGTMNGSRVIYDQTIPTIPTTVSDRLGAPITDLKHRINAIFNWSGDTDPTTNSAIVSNIWKYRMRLTNQNGEIHKPDNTVSLFNNFGSMTGTRQWDATISELAPWVGQRIPARTNAEAYETRMVVVDKAGNYSGGNVTAPDFSSTGNPLYVQPYSIGIYGKIIDEHGDPVKNALVQVVARFGEECQTGTDVCSGSSNEDGDYSIVLKAVPGQVRNYNVTVQRANLYLAKREFTILEQNRADDVEENFTLEYVGIHEAQSFDQTISIRTNLVFIENGIKKFTIIYVKAKGGQASIVRNTDGTHTLTSLTEITSVTSNNPLVYSKTEGTNIGVADLGNDRITDNKDNTFLLTGIGAVVQNSGNLLEFDKNPNKLGIGYVPANGGGIPFGGASLSDFNLNGFRTSEEIAAMGKKYDEGWAGKILTYINRNGYEVFGGYLTGKLPISKMTKTRAPRARSYKAIRIKEKFLNYGSSLVKQVSNLIGGSSLEVAVDDSASNENISGVANVGTIVEGNSIYSKSIGIPRRKTGDESASIAAKRSQKARLEYEENKILPKARKVVKVESLAKPLDMKKLKIRFNGKSLPMSLLSE